MLEVYNTIGYFNTYLEQCYKYKGDENAIVLTMPVLKQLYLMIAFFNVLCVLKPYGAA
jgi:hypothetical protein